MRGRWMKEDYKGSGTGVFWPNVDIEAVTNNELL